MYGQTTVAIGITDGSERIAAYVTGSMDEVISILSETFSGNIYFSDVEESINE